MTALPNQVKDTWDVNMDMTSTFTCGYGYIKWRNVTKEDELCPSGAYTSIDFPLFRTADAYLMAAEAILRGANGTQSEALGYVNGNNWDWKNGVRLGADVDDKYNLFPIPESELTNNPTLVQNDGYKVIK